MPLTTNIDVTAYLARLGIPRPAAPDVATLFALHQAQAERIPYENLAIHLGRSTTVDPAESVARFVRGGGGYCFHLNGAFAALLEALGYQVTRHEGEVRNAALDAEDDPLITTTHAALVVRCEGREWFVDTGLNALYEPMPLLDGAEVRQGPFTVRLERWKPAEAGWRLIHDPLADSFTAMVFTQRPVPMAAFAPAHLRLANDPDSGQSRILTAGLVRADGAHVLRGPVLTRIDAGGRERRVLEDPRDWFAALADVFGLTLDDVDEAGRAALWRRTVGLYQAFLASKAA